VEAALFTKDQSLVVEGTQAMRSDEGLFACNEVGFDNDVPLLWSRS